MKKEKILYATKIGEPSYMEDIISEHEERFEDAKKWATANGFDRFRIAEIDFSIPPDFIKSIKI